MTAHQRCVLAEVRVREPLTAADLAAALGHDVSNARRLLQRLERQGLTEYARAAYSGAELRWTLTDAGIEAASC
jgi:DNA-binding MarR family transcriptional regulator